MNKKIAAHTAETLATGTLRSRLRDRRFAHCLSRFDRLNVAASPMAAGA